MSGLLWRMPLLCLLLACSLTPAFADQPRITPIINITELKAIQASTRSQPVLVDVREVDEYQAGHLPGALNIPVDRTFNQFGDPSRIASLAQIRELLSEIGIQNTDYIVLYDDGMLKSAAHVFWVMETYGHKKISVLDGGINAWIHEGGKLTRNIPKRERSAYIPSVSGHRLSTKLATLLATKNTNVAIIDSRKHQEYLGKISKARRKGHIPTAINIPSSDNLQGSGNNTRLKSKKTLQSIYGALGHKHQVIAYCNRGKDSALTYLILRSLGVNVSVYDGAWYEWGNDPKLPIEVSPHLAGQK